MLEQALSSHVSGLNALSDLHSCGLPLESWRARMPAWGVGGVREVGYRAGIIELGGGKAWGDKGCGEMKEVSH